MAELKDLDTDEIKAELIILSTTSSVYHTLHKNAVVNELKKKEFTLEELATFTNERVRECKPGFLSIQDYTMSALSIVLEERYRHGDSTDPVVCFAEDFILTFAANGGGEFGGTRRLCRYILHNSV